MVWIVRFTPEAERDAEKLDRSVRVRIVDKLEWLEAHFDTAHPSPLGGPWRGFFKLRVGERRVIYRISWDTHELWVILVDLHDRIYKRPSRT